MKAAEVTPPPIPYSVETENIPPDEPDDIRQVIEAVQALLQRSLQKTGRYQPDVHVKSDGGAQGEFRILPNLPAELAQGLFQSAQTYPAIVRFSNSSPQAQADWVPDGRGMAIKLLGVDGPPALADETGRTQDFIMINHPAFVARNVKDYLRMEHVLVAANDNSLAVVAGALTGGEWNPLNWHWNEAVTALRIAGHLPAHLASLTYFSMVPIRFGQYVAKYRMQPVGGQPDSFVEVIQRLGQSADALRMMLEETLRSQPVQFEFQVQLRNSAEAMPIEDATVEWPESISPFQTVAVLSLPQQEIGDAAWIEACRRLSFNVWHALADHRPLGGINRVRRDVYRISAEWRHTLVEGECKEPQNIGDMVIR